MVKQKVKELPDDLILKILSKLPLFKEIIATRLISKHHEEPWNLKPDVTLVDDNEESLVTFLSFVYGSLLFGDDQTLESLHLKLAGNYSASDINFLVQVAVNRSVRKLRFDYVCRGTLVLPSCLSNSTTLKSLILRDVSINLVPRGFSLPSLKSLHLFNVGFSQSIVIFLRRCPNLEYLVLHQTCYGNWNLDKVAMHWVRLSSLKSLHLLSATCYSRRSLTSLLQSCPILEHLVLHQHQRQLMSLTPPASCLSSIKSLHLSSFSFYMDEDIAKLLKREMQRRQQEESWVLDKCSTLETLNIKDTVSNFLMLEFMPEVTKANIQVICDQSEKFIGSLTLVKHLSLCSPTSETPYRGGSIFPYLEHLELCTCSSGWANLLASILNDAPRLQSLTLKSNHSTPCNDPMNVWNEPAVVPECLLMHLEIFEWRQYEDTVQHRKAAAYILENAIWLKTATFSTSCGNTDHGMLVKIKKLNRVSETCQLVFK